MITILNNTYPIYQDKIISELSYSANNLNFKYLKKENEITFSYLNHNWKISIDKYNRSMVFLKDGSVIFGGLKESNLFEEKFMKIINNYLVNYNENIPY